MSGLIIARVINVLLAVVAVSLLILVHEVGHFIAAKAVGMRVEVFSIGFWKKLVGFRLGETEYRLSLVPLGGYVKVSGESPEEGKGRPHEFWSKSPGQRALFIAGGVTMNLLLAIVLFMVAFAIGVPFAVAEVGATMPGEPAWEVGLKPGDVITAVDGQQDPTFVELTRTIALGGRQALTLEVRRHGEPRTFVVEPHYREDVGLRVIGIRPPIETMVRGLAAIGRDDGQSPAREAGIQIGDRILAINDAPVSTLRELGLELQNYPDDEVEVDVARDGELLSFRVHARPVPVYVIGISGLSTRVKALEGDGMAERLGFEAGDEVAAVNGREVANGMELEEVLREELGQVAFTVQRGERAVEILVELPDRKALALFEHSIQFHSGATLRWVEEGGPAWSVGMRPGDVVVSVAGQEVESWRDVMRGRSRAGEDPHEIKWRRGARLLTARVEPAADTSLSGGHLGVILDKQKSEPRRYGALAAVREGLKQTLGTFAEIFLTLRGFATRQVSPRHMGGILTIAYVSYHAAGEGIGKLLYFTAIISAAIAFLNILPIPVLDGGHLLFTAIEKVRGKRLSERVLTVAQTIGFVALVLLVIYVTRNDILRLFQWN